MFTYNTGLIRESREQDADHLGKFLREADLLEMKSFRQVTDPCIYLKEGIKASFQCWTCTDKKGVPIFVFGVVPVIPNLYGAVWLMGTERIHEVKKEFIKDCKNWLPRLHQGFPLIGNFVYAENAIHVKWLKFMGFNFVGKKDNFGLLGLPFYEILHKQA